MRIHFIGRPWVATACIAGAACLAPSWAHATGTVLINANGMIACPTIEGAHLVAQAKEAYGLGDVGAQSRLIGRARAEHCNKIEAGEVRTVGITGIDLDEGVMRLAVTFGERGVELFAPIHVLNDNPVWYGELPKNIEPDGSDDGEP
ncbi:MAG TPA: hypothetical protein VMU33_14715 [Burkholderiaceae bacterium]|nr:hypothetical protein [Burkholderiaceae bacterium]